MVKNEYILTKIDGLTSRIASNIVNLANRYSSSIKINHKNDEANAKSIMNVMALIIKRNEQFSITYDGDDEIEASTTIDNYLKSLDII